MPEASKAFPEVTLTVKPDPLSRRDELVIAAQVTDPADGQTYAWEGRATAGGPEAFQVREILAVGGSVLEATTRRALSIQRGPEAPPGEPPLDPEPPPPELVAARAEVAKLRLVAAAALDGWQGLIEGRVDVMLVDQEAKVGELRDALVAPADPRDLRDLVARYRQACEAEGMLNMEGYPAEAKVARVEAAVERAFTRLGDALGIPRRQPRIRQVAPDADTVQLPPPDGGR